MSARDTSDYCIRGRLRYNYNPCLAYPQHKLQKDKARASTPYLYMLNSRTGGVAARIGTIAHALACYAPYPSPVQEKDKLLRLTQQHV